MTERPINHGTIYAYSGRGCRCAVCTEKYRVYSREYRRSPSGSVTTRRTASRNNYIRQQALAWVRVNHPEVIAEIEASWSRKEILAPTPPQ